jgi:tetratricopeptide (TPR) repeat protein
MTCYQALADSYKLNGRYQDAKIALHKFLEIANAELPPDDPTIMFALDSLGWVCMRLGELDTSAQHLRQALVIASARFGSQSPMTLRSKLTLAEVLGKLGLASEAETLCLELKDQVRSRRENGTPLPRDSISQLNTLAAVLMQQGKFEEAVEMYEVVVQDREKALGVKHRMTLWATSQLAAAKISNRELQQALKLLEGLLPMQEEVLGDHPDIQETRKRIDELRAELA